MLCVCVVINLTAVPALDILLCFKYIYKNIFWIHLLEIEYIWWRSSRPSVVCGNKSCAGASARYPSPPLPPPPSPQYSGVYLQYIWYILLLLFLLLLARSIVEYIYNIFGISFSPPLPPPPPRSPHSYNNPENGLLMNTPQIVLFGNCVSPNCIRSPVFDD